MSALAAEHKQQREWARLRGAFSGYTHAREYHKSSLCVASTSDTVVGGSWSSVSNCRVFHPESLMRPADPGQLRSAWLSSGRFDQLRSAEISSEGSKNGTRFASVLATTAFTKATISRWFEFLGPTGDGAPPSDRNPSSHAPSLQTRRI